MQSRIILLTACLGFLLATAGAAWAESGNVSLILGAKTLNEDDWSTNDDQFEVGIEADRLVTFGD